MEELDKIALLMEALKHAIEMIESAVEHSRRGIRLADLDRVMSVLADTAIEARAAIARAETEREGRGGALLRSAGARGPRGTR